jgi:hypothetical protein
MVTSEELGVEIEDARVPPCGRWYHTTGGARGVTIPPEGKDVKHGIVTSISKKSGTIWAFCGKG